MVLATNVKVLRAHYPTEVQAAQAARPLLRRFGVVGWCVRWGKPSPGQLALPTLSRCTGEGTRRGCPPTEIQEDRAGGVAQPLLQDPFDSSGQAPSVPQGRRFDGVPTAPALRSG